MITCDSISICIESLKDGPTDICPTHKVNYKKWYIDSIYNGQQKPKPQHHHQKYLNIQQFTNSPILNNHNKKYTYTSAEYSKGDKKDSNKIYSQMSQQSSPSQDRHHFNHHQTIVQQETLSRVNSNGTLNQLSPMSPILSSTTIVPPSSTNITLDPLSPSSVIASSPKPLQHIYCIHGYLGNASEFDTIAQELLKNDPYRVIICPDLPGRKGSDRFESTSHYSWKTYAHVIESIISEESRCVAYVDVLATSVSVNVPLYMVSQNNRRIRSIISNGGGSQISRQTACNLISSFQAIFGPHQSYEDACRVYRMIHSHNYYFGDLSSTEWNRFYETNIIKTPTGQYTIDLDPRLLHLDMGKEFSSWDLFNKAISSDCKMLVLRGESSKSYSQQDYEAMKLRMAHTIEFQTLKGTGVSPLLKMDHIKPIITFLSCPDSPSSSFFSSTNLSGCCAQKKNSASNNSSSISPPHKIIPSLRENKI
ncbi:hypothetical protein DFA_05601 [Cavenderia fasciculata]|uniref:Uncharacterized protein n=1 Tax=Cavenderia fasciculata TaxID=261658 RepID=F4PLP6_CACFS|nr:uncharacterized protein DFA_05601 [Cavenderia fasciculata]EGG23468.1 hypothetical protein DFA_05601 [Cavenderia fasciculata]|eukprot:XP_004361319.1 hypothetical protein DFA_05601 [Cavenderia fasciculata]